MRQANPFERGRDAGQELEPRAAILLRNAPGDAFDPTDHRLVRIGHQGGDHSIARLHSIDVVLSEVSVDPVAIDIDQRDLRLIGHHLAPETEQEIGDVAVDRCQHRGELEVELGLLEGSFRRANLWVLVVHGSEIRLGFGEIRLGLGQIGFCLPQTGLGCSALLHGNLISRLGLLVGLHRSGLAGKHFLLTFVLRSVSCEVRLGFFDAT